MTGFSDLTPRQLLLGPVPKLDLTVRRRFWWAVDQAGSGALLLWLMTR